MRPHPCGAWTPPPALVAADFWRQYLFAFYWALASSTSQYGEAPQTGAQTALTMATGAFGIFLAASVIGSAASVLEGLSAHRTAYQMKLDRINHYMRWQKLPNGLRKRVNEYYEYMWTCHAELSAKGLVDELPEPLQVEIRTLIKSRLIDSQPLFLHLEPTLMLRLVDALVSFVAIPHQQIVAEGEVGTRMYARPGGKLGFAPSFERTTCQRGEHQSIRCSCDLRRGRGVADSSPRNIRVAAAPSPRLVAAEYPRRGRGVAATRPRHVRAAKVSRRRYFLVSGEAIVYCARPALDPELQAQREAELQRKRWPLLRTLSKNATRWRFRRGSNTMEAQEDTPAIRRLRETVRRNLHNLVNQPRRESMEYHPDIANQLKESIRSKPIKPKSRSSSFSGMFEQQLAGGPSHKRRKSVATLQAEAAARRRTSSAGITNEPLFICKLKQGACFGEMALQSGGARTASVMTIGFCDLYYLEAEAYHAIIDTDSGTVLRTVMERLAEKRRAGKLDVTDAARAGAAAATPSEHRELLSQKTSSSHRLREDVIERNTKHQRRGDTARAAKRRLSGTGLVGGGG